VYDLKALISWQAGTLLQLVKAILQRYLKQMQRMIDKTINNKDAPIPPAIPVK